MMVDSIMRFVVLFLWGEGGVSAKWVKCGGLTLILSQEEEFFWPYVRFRVELRMAEN